MTKKFAVVGTGCWAHYQLSAWQELAGAECIALCDPVRTKAETFAKHFSIDKVYEDAEILLETEALDFIDVITPPETHAPLVHLAARYNVPVICQKPMALDLKTAEGMVEICQQTNTPFMIHENWRWQYPIRQIYHILQNSDIGRPFRAHMIYANTFPVFDDQLALKAMEQFIIADLGAHILDTARFLFGEAHSLYCQTRRVNPEIKGEDVATIMMNMGEDITVTCSISYTSQVEHDRFPETFIFVECENGSVELAPDYWVQTTTIAGTSANRYVPPRYGWANPAYDLVHSSLVACNQNLLQAIETGQPAETSGEDNLKTTRLVYTAYESAQTGQAIMLS